ncbi:uncharacterized protein LOC134771995 [Penaeus indicus]|uniref:uncharacterized protein LOC134771995 n=1 Tax=Penaeus indicus TaxID=29960 RepID=UPI00300D9685
MLLVMETTQVFHTADGFTRLWTITWDRIDAFLPDFRHHIFRSHPPSEIHKIEVVPADVPAKAPPAEATVPSPAVNVTNTAAPTEIAGGNPSNTYPVNVSPGIPDQPAQNTTSSLSSSPATKEAYVPPTLQEQGAARLSLSQESLPTSYGTGVILQPPLPTLLPVSPQGSPPATDPQSAASPLSPQVLSTTPLASGSLASSPIPPTLPHLTPSPLPHTVSLPELNAQNTLMFTPMAIQKSEPQAETPFASPMLQQPSVPLLNVSCSSSPAENAVTTSLTSPMPSYDMQGPSPITSFSSVESPSYQCSERQGLYPSDQDSSNTLHMTSDVQFYTPCGNADPSQRGRTEDSQSPGESGGSIPLFDLPAAPNSQTSPSPDTQTPRQPDVDGTPKPLPDSTPSTQGSPPETLPPQTVGSVFPLSIPSFLNPFSTEVDARQEVSSATNNAPVEPTSAHTPEPRALKDSFPAYRPASILFSQSADDKLFVVDPMASPDLPQATTANAPDGSLAEKSAAEVSEEQKKPPVPLLLTNSALHQSPLTLLPPGGPKNQEAL